MRTIRKRVSLLSILENLQLLTTLGTVCLARARPALDDGSALLQRRPGQTGVVLVSGTGASSVQEAVPREFGGGVGTAEARVGMGSWTTTPWGDCSARCALHLKSRAVTCRSWRTGAAMPDESCRARPRPLAVQACNCALEFCVPQSEGSGICGLGSAEEVPDKEAEGTFELIGCFNRSTKIPGEAVCPKVPPYDEDCIGWKAQGACRGGLPFYRSCAHTDSTACAGYCLRRGLDLSGIIYGAECRCGASVINENVWHGRTEPPPALLFQHGPSSPWDPRTGACPLLLSRYTGFFISGGVPLALMTAVTFEDEAYIDGLVENHHITPEQELDKPGQEVPAMQKHSRRQSTAPWENRRCWPHLCSPLVGPVRGNKAQTTAPQGVANRWNHYMIMDYHFHAELATQGAGDPLKIKEVFRLAAEKWQESTCIVFVEKAEGTNIEIVQEDPTACHVSSYVSLLTGRTLKKVQVNLGFCNNNNELVSVIHEIGHVIGMNHEQRRPDATQVFHGHGPFLRISWMNIPASWTDQWTADDSSYMGSVYDGPGDPKVGYADYDFGSIMHYPLRNWAQTIDSDNSQLVGNRASLSEGDINQALDMYQCMPVTAPVAGPHTFIDVIMASGPFLGSALGLGFACCCGWMSRHWGTAPYTATAEAAFQ
mmetsp:Transcript_45271/g.129256  ORF Transcript_45271/g.129256 Transcript_45271/m.129256 type:complete len:655 (+) Transcript_45271:60-2024(+)